jgi:hypothetical protein
MALSQIDKEKKQKDYDKKMAESMQPHNYYAVDTHTNRGDYDVNDGMYDPYRMGYKSKGTQANPIGASSTFVKYGGMIKAAEGMTVPGDQIVQRAFLPDVSTDVVGPVRTVAQNAPIDVVETSSSATSENSNYTLPLKNFKISSGFGHRKAPKSGASTEHNGLDLSVPLNSDVFSPMDGVVKNIYTNSTGGKQLLVQHPDGSVSGYAHLNNYKVGIGDKVTKGQIIALSGNTGNSTGPHLHFTWHTPDGKTVDPRSIFNFDLRTVGGEGSGQQISLSHNNPMNVHYGDFAAKYGAKPGADDNGGKVAMFPDLETGIQANKDLMFGPGYNTLTIAEARNKWVTGNTGQHSNSTDEIVKAMGGNKRLSALSPEEKDKLFKEFTKWEGKQSYNIVKDRKIFKEGGQSTDNTTNMKIRIVGGPNNMAQGGEPQYSGQSDYGLYIGQRNLYNTMAKNPYSEAGDKVGEQDETENNPHVLEAEGGETILRPDGTHMKISGPSHANGGVKLTKSQAPEGSFIYSKTKKMEIKNPEILQHFGKSAGKGGVTPAEIAKQYDVNKYMGILQDPTADILSKKTAMRMVENYQRKLAELALVQEGLKGFPQGIPEVAKSVVSAAAGPMQGMAPSNSQAPSPGQQQQQAKYGGALRKFVGGGPNDYDPEFLKAAKFMTEYEQQGSEAGPNGYVGGGKNWGTNKNDIKSQDQAIKYYYDKYWPMVKDLPPGLRTRALQMAVNTGDPYGELMVAGSSFKGVDEFSPQQRINSKGQRKDLSPNKFTGDDWKNRQAQVIAAYNSNPTEFMKNLDSEQDRYYNQGLQGMSDDQRKFLTGYYKGTGKVANDFMVQTNPLSDDPFGLKNTLQNAGANNTPTGAPTTTQTATAPAAGSAGPSVVAQGPVPKWFSPWVKANTKAGSLSPTGKQTVFDPKDPNKFYTDYNYWKTINKGKDFNNPEEFQNFVYDYVSSKDPKAIEAMWTNWGNTNRGKAFPNDKRKAFADKFFGARTAELAGGTETTTTAPPSVIPTTTTTIIPGVTPTTTVLTTIPPPGTTPTTTISPYNWTNQDVRDLGNAGLDYASLKKYHPYRASVQPVLPEFIPTDWRGYAASLQSQQNKAADQMGTYQPGQALGANLSFLQGQTGSALGDYISKVDQYNASGASNMDLQRAGIQNQFSMYNAENRNKNFEDENVYDDRYRTAERLARKGIVKAWNQGEDNATKIYNLNQVESPYYQIHAPTQKMVFNSDNAKAKWIAENKGAYVDPGSGAKAASELKDIYDNLTWVPEADRADYAYDIWHGGTGKGKVANKKYPNQPAKDNTTTVEETATQP